VQPRKPGYRLTEEGQEAYESFETSEYGGCNCHNHPPCASCTDPGNPNNIQETDEFWEKVPIDPNIFDF